MYVELHCHTNFSFLDGASHPVDMVARAREIGMPALAITDHNGLYGIVRFHREARELGIKPIIGAEMTLDDGCHLTLIAKNNTGYSNLCRLVSHAQLSNSKGKASLDFDTLAGNSSGLFCLSGCRNGEVPASLLAGDRERAFIAARKYIETFGRENFWIELQNSLCPRDRELCEQLVEMAGILGVGHVATNNVHYARRESHRLQDVLVCINNRTTLDESHHIRRPNSECYLKSEAEMSRLFAEYSEAVRNTVRIAGACDVTLDFSSYRFPDFKAPDGETADSFLERLCRQEMPRKYDTASPEAERRLREELDLVRRLGLAGYFLTVWDIMEYARSNGIPAQGRGSAASSIVTYLLGVTRVDPVKHNLFAGRFLNDEMSAIPDIDIDIASDSEDHREKLIRYIYEKYGTHHAAMVCNVVTYRARNAVRDVGKAMGLPPHVVDAAAKSMERHSAGAIGEDLARMGEFESQIGSKPWRQFLDMCGEIAEFPRHLGIHVGGMLISTFPLTDVVPVERATKPGRVVTQWDKDDINDVGLIKIDLLGLRMLSLIDEAVKLVEENRGLSIDLEKIPLDDPDVYDMLCDGDTIGVFQVESRAQQATLPRSRPRCFEDLIAEVAIIRPGPIQGNAVHPYLRRRQGREEVSYLHPRLKPVLEETLGVIIYQEQVIQTAIAIAGFTTGEADSLRRAMSRKRSREAMARLEERFLEGARENGIDEDIARTAFSKIAGFAEFGFCKAHAAALAETTHRSAWLKLHYPAEYYCALLNCQPMGFYSPEVIVNYAKRNGVDVLPVDVNRSRARCTVEDGKIRLGFRYVRGVGEKGWPRIEKASGKGPYTSPGDFCWRTGLDREAVENLILAGAFDYLGVPRRRLLWQLGLLVREAPDMLALDFPSYQVTLPAMSLGERIAADYSVQGLSATHHPMEVFRSGASRKGILRSSEVPALDSGRRVRVAGCVVCRQKPLTAKGVVFITLEDEHGLVNVILRPDIYERYRRIARMEPFIVVDGELQKKDGVVNVVASRLAPLKAELQREGTGTPFAAPRSRDFQ
jgi:error-prone DNA polymerase